MKKEFKIFIISVMMISAVAITAIAQQGNDKKENKKEQQKGPDKKENKGKDNKGRDKDDMSQGNRKDQKDKDRDDDGRKIKDQQNDRQDEDFRLGKKDGYKWDRETFKDRNKIRNQDKVTICHKFNNNDSEPAVTIRVSSNALNAHMNHGDVMGECPQVTNTRFSDVFLRRRTDYYNTLQNSQEQVIYSRSILDYAVQRLTDSRVQLVNLQNRNAPVADLERKQAVVVELEQNVSLLETILGVTAALVANKLQ